ncbi:DUF1801 domain-containing protein [Plantactinospora sp. GCM10030261]|uniref:DUF1801 domain-containing protein n=1 Tax=Plantactinospora sp. GCM10030261 TaxID=3273420 RepID=UPI003609A004
MGNPEVDAVVEAKVLPQHRDIVATLRAMMAEHAPQAREVVLYGSPAWKGNKSMAVISPSKAHITFAFDRGAEFDDRHGLLEGTGKKTRHVKIKTVDGIDRDALCDYISQAVTLDQG